MNKTTFEKVSELNQAFGNARGDILKPDAKKILSQAKLCLEESVEMLTEGFPGLDVKVTVDRSNWHGELNLDQILDAQGDLTTVNDGVAHIVGFNGNLGYSRVHRSNMSKFIVDEAGVQPALEYYYDLGLVVEDLRIEGEFPQKCIKVARDCVDSKGKSYPVGKFLKNMHAFQEPVFDDILDGRSAQYVDRIMIVDSRYSLDKNHFALNTHFGSQKLIEFMNTQHSIIGDEWKSDPVLADDGTIISWRPLFTLNEQNLPELPFLWGTWQGQVRWYQGYRTSAYEAPTADEYIRVL